MTDHKTEKAQAWDEGWAARAEYDRRRDVPTDWPDRNPYRSAEKDHIHWGHVDSRPTSLHGNGAASFERTTLDPAEVTCRLCVTLLADSESLSWVDRHGDVWRVGEDGLMWTPETAPFPREHVEKKWGPLRLVDTRYRPGGEG